MPYLLPNTALISLTRATRFSVSSGLPPRSRLAGYSQSMSTPWNPHLSMKSVAEDMKAALVSGLEHISDQVVKVGPGSLKSNPPNAIQVCRVLDLRAANSEYRARSSGSVGVILKYMGSMEANAKFRWVRPRVLI